MFNRAYAKVMDGTSVAIGDHLNDIIQRRSGAGEFGPRGMGSVFQSVADLDFTRPRRQRPNWVFVNVDSAPYPPWVPERLTSAGKILEVCSSPAVEQCYTVVTYTDVTESKRGAQELEQAVAAGRRRMPARHASSPP
ncbi:MAG: hypothetical protein EXR09_02305 [Acetobacteraceae bacterium]|nr:hypothetical protein [Acetobacteraceae bacterium]